MSRIRRPLCSALLTALALGSTTDTLQAQGSCRPGTTCSFSDQTSLTPRWQGHALAFGLNVVLGGVTSGMAHAFKGESFWEGFARGGAGGGVAYLGKYLVTQDFPGAKLVGRQTSALGASMTHNALTGQGLFETLSFPIGPIRIHRSPNTPRVTLDLLTVGGFVYAITRPGAMLDLPESFASAAFVFEVDSLTGGGDSFITIGRAIGGVALYRSTTGLGITHREVISHELVHVLQHDYAGIAFGNAFEGWLGSKLPDPIAKPLSYIDLGTYTALKLIPLALGYRGSESPWEREAYFLTDQDRHSQQNMPQIMSQHR